MNSILLRSSARSSRLLPRPLASKTQPQKLVKRAFALNATFKLQQEGSKASALEYREAFVNRHVGIGPKDEKAMLEKVGVKTLDELIKKTVPKEIQLNRDLDLSAPLSKLFLWTPCGLCFQLTVPFHLGS